MEIPPDDRGFGFACAARRFTRGWVLCVPRARPFSATIHGRTGRLARSLGRASSTIGTRISPEQRVAGFHTPWIRMSPRSAWPYGVECRRRRWFFTSSIVTRADGALKSRKAVTVRLPVDRAPKRIVSSPRIGPAKRWGRPERVIAGSAWRSRNSMPTALRSWIMTRYPTAKLSGRRLVPSMQWARPSRNEFTVESGGVVRDQWVLPGMLQGKLHAHLRNPPTFSVNMPSGGSMQVHVRGVATLGARLEWKVDGKGREDDRPFPTVMAGTNRLLPSTIRHSKWEIPSGRHKITLDNVGGTGPGIGWYAFSGENRGP